MNREDARLSQSPLRYGVGRPRCFGAEATSSQAAASAQLAGRRAPAPSPRPFFKFHARARIADRAAFGKCACARVRTDRPGALLFTTNASGNGQADATFTPEDVAAFRDMTFSLSWTVTGPATYVSGYTVTVLD
jgi:hypothetical protein